jgi:hypothetical protein
MTRHRWFRWGALVCALALTVPAAAAPVPGEQEKPLAQVPAKSAIVIQLRGFERTRDRLDALIKNAVPDFAAQSKDKLDAFTKEALDGRELKGLTREGPIFVVFTELPKADQAVPKMAVLLPVARYESFRDGVLKEEERKTLKTDSAGYESATLENKETIYFVNRKNGYAVVSPDADVAASFAQKYDSIADKLSKPLARRLMEADVSAYVDMAAVNKAHGDDIKQWQQFFEQALDASPDRNTAEMAKRLYGPLFQAVLDSTALLASADLRPDGALLHLDMEVPADSKTNALLKEWKSLPTAELSKLPAGQMVYSGMAYTPSLMKTLGSLAYGVLADPDSKEGKAIQKAIDELADAKPRLRLDATSVPMSGLQVWKYDNPAKAVDAQMKLFKALKEGGTYGAVLKGDPVIKEGAQKHAGFDFNSVSMKWDLEKTVDKQGAALNEDQKKVMIEYMKGMLGEGADIWLGTDGKTVLQVTAKDWSEARALVDGYVKGSTPLGQSQPFKDAAKHLPSEASVLMLVDVPQYSEVLVKVVVGILQQSGLPIPIPPGFEKPAVKGKTTYLGVGVSLEPGRAGFDVWIGASNVHEVYKMYLERLFKQGF